MIWVRAHYGQSAARDRYYHSRSFFLGGMREKETSSSLCQHARRKRERDPVSVSCRHFAAAARGHATATKIRKNWIYIPHGSPILLFLAMAPVRYTFPSPVCATYDATAKVSRFVCVGKLYSQLSSADLPFQGLNGAYVYKAFTLLYCNSSFLRCGSEKATN